MFKHACALLALFTAGITLKAFPLEWNINNPTEIPYEVEISRAKLEQLAGVGKECGFEVTATTSKGKKKLDVTLLQGQKSGSVAVRFVVPQGTSALDCQPVKNGTLSPAEKLNLFAGVLSDASFWKAANKMSVKAQNGKITAEAKHFGESSLTCTVKVPENFSGLAAKLEFDFKSTAKETYPCYINIRQTDAQGKILAESLTDPRWLTMMRPSGVLTCHRESGRIHPKAATITLNIKVLGVTHEYDSFGNEVKDKSVFLPKFEISHLAVRAAEQIPFPKYRDEFFAKGVSGRDDDFAFDATKGATGKAFFFATHSQACWAEGKTISDLQELFYPAGDGTVEAWFNPVWKDIDKKNNYTCLFAADPAQFVGPMGNSRGFTNSCLAIRYFPLEKTAEVEFMDYTKKLYKNKFKCEIPEKQWSHVAVQWTTANGMQIFVNGKKVFDDPKFTYTPVDFNSPVIRNAKKERKFSANEFMASQFSLGNTRYVVRSNKGIRHFRGYIDLLRISSVPRYNGNFTPEKRFSVDRDTRALFDFDRSFDGRTSDGLKYISGSVMAEVSRIEDKLEVNGKIIDYNPPQILDSNHPFKVLDIRNYKKVPDDKDFAAARKSEKIVFNTNGCSEKTVTLDDDVLMDYIEYKNTGKNTVIHPFMRRDTEIDPRSFGDIRNSMNVTKVPARDRANRIFQFVISSSDYFGSHQIYFSPGSDQPRNANYMALTMLNSYCGFECGSQNNMTANIFASSGALPAGQTAGYGHSFQQVWFDGKSNLYDLAAQKFFPSFDNTNPASLADVELEPGIQNRVKGNSDHFIRLGTRNFVAQAPAFSKKVAMNIRPGETLRMWYANNGRFNEIHYLPALNSFKHLKNVSDKVYIKNSKTNATEVDRPFPEFGSAFLFFNDAPAKFAKNFTSVNADSFCYNVTTCYPTVYAEYAAILADGKFAGLEISTDRGKTFRKLERDADGTARPYYPVCGRMEYLIKVNAPISKVKNFSAMTQMITNTRVMTCKLKKGKNKLLYTAGNNADVQLTLQYRKYVKDITISGEVVKSGSERGYERITTVLAPGESKQFTVKGISPAAAVKSTGKLNALLKGGTLTVSVPDSETKSIETTTIVDNGAEKELTVIIHPGIELVTAENITPASEAVLVDDKIQKNIKFSSRKSVIKMKLKKSKTAGIYSIWNCVRFSANPGWTRVLLQLPQGGTTEVFRHLNSQSEFLKSRFYGENGRGKFFWTFQYQDYYTRLRINMGKEFDSLTYKTAICNDKYAELAGTIIIPNPDNKFFNDMVKILCGINNRQHSINESNQIK